MVALIQPQGNSPLNDDWTFGGSVKLLLDNGSIRLPDWGAPNLVAQLLWGALFCLRLDFRLSGDFGSIRTQIDR